MQAYSRASRLLGVQYLRAAAALMVAYCHLRIQIPAYTEYLTPLWAIDTDRLRGAVDVFFVISGFVMMVTSQHLAPGTFFMRRIIRVAPLYWLLTCSLVALALVAPQLFRTTQVTPEFVLKSLLFVPYANPGQSGESVPLLVLGWTLNLEMFFYAIFAAALFGPVRIQLVIVGAIFTMLVVTGALLPSLSRVPFFWFYARPMIMEFWLGMVIAHWYLRGSFRQIPVAACLALVIGGIAALMARAHVLGDSQIAWTVPAVAIVLGAVALEQKRGIPYVGWLALLGDASYSIYLTHIFTLGITRSIWSSVRIGGSGHAALFAITSMAAVAVAAVLAHRWVEEPLLRLSKRLIAVRRDVRVGVAVEPR